MAQSILDIILRTTSQGASNASKQVIGSLTELNSFINMASMAATSVYNTAKQAYDATVQTTLDYADQVRELSLLTGESAESTSRMIQVADDARISYESLTTSLQAAVRKGVDPSVASIGALSDQYLRLNPGLERSKFLMDTFGRSGSDMAKLMELGSEKIRQMNDAIEDGLVLDEVAIQQALQYQRALDNLEDSWKALEVTVGQRVIPTMSLLISTNDEVDDSLKDNKIALLANQAVWTLSGNIIASWATLVYDANNINKESTKIIQEQVAADQALATAQQEAASEADRLAYSISLSGKSINYVVDQLDDYGYSVSEASNITTVLKGDLASLSGTEDQLKSDIDLVNQAFLTKSITLEEYRVHMANAQAGVFGLSDAERETMQAAIDHAAAVRGDAEAAAALARSTTDAAISQMQLAESLKGASKAQIAQAFIQELNQAYQSGAISGADYASAVNDVQVAFGLVTANSTALAAGIGFLVQAMEDGYTPTQSWADLLGIVVTDAADGTLNYESLNAAIGDMPAQIAVATRPLSDIDGMVADLAGSAGTAYFNLSSIFALPPRKDIEVHITVTGDKVPNLGGGTGRGDQMGTGYAYGGILSGGQSGMVGEYGPEWFRAPAGGGEIIPTGQFGGQTLVVNYYNSPALSLNTEYELENALEPAIRAVLRRI